MLGRFDTSRNLEDGVFESTIGVGKLIKGRCHQVPKLKEEAKRLQRLGHWCFGNECRWEKHLDNLKVDTLSHAHLALKHVDISHQWLCIWWSVSSFDNDYHGYWMSGSLIHLLQLAASSLALSRLIQTWCCECDMDFTFQGLSRTIPVWKIHGRTL